MVTLPSLNKKNCKLFTLLNTQQNVKVILLLLLTILQCRKSFLKRQIPISNNNNYRRCHSLTEFAPRNVKFQRYAFTTERRRNKK